MKIKIYLDKEDVEEYLEYLANNFSEDNFENALADFHAHPK